MMMVPSLTADWVVELSCPLLLAPTSRPLAILPANWLPMLPPELTLTGKWLEQFGFTTGRRIEVITEPGQLIIHIIPATEGTAL
ncbi:SymE family type I addiction module toxin [Serratia grimesii]